MESKLWKWVLGLTYIFAVAAIWIAASFVVQSVVDAGVSPFLITYICNSLFVIYIPLVEIGRYIEDTYGTLWFWQRPKRSSLQALAESEKTVLLGDSDEPPNSDPYALVEDRDIVQHENAIDLETRHVSGELDKPSPVEEIVKEGVKKLVDVKGRWTRTRTAKVSLLICPFWFLAQLAFNLSLKYTTVTSNTILSSSSSLFTFLVALAFLGEKFTWLKLISVLLCMGGTVIVSLGDSQSNLNAIASNPFLGDILALLSAALYAAYITLIRKKLPDDDDEKSGRPSMALFLGFLGLFNLLIFLPIALILSFSKLEPFYMLTWKQVGLIVGKGLLDNVLSDYLWAKAVLLTSTTVATAGLTIQVPMAAVVDSLIGNAPHLMDYLGALAVMIGFAGINIPSDTFSTRKADTVKLESENASSSVQNHTWESLNAAAVT